jgi:NADH-quinone oxidoreductase subunit E
MNSENTEIKFKDETLAKVKSLMARYPEGRHKSALLPALHIAQKEFGNWLSDPVMDYVAEIFNIKPIEVYEVATFYSMYNLKPVGNCLIEFCQTGPCMCCGVEDVMEYTEQKLGIKMGETTKDGKFTIKGVECLGACGYAPMAQIGEYYYEKLTKEKIDKIISEFGQDNYDPNKLYEI